MGLINKIRETYGGRKLRQTVDFTPTPGWEAFSQGIQTSVAAYGSGNWIKAYENSAELYSVASFLIRKMMSIPWHPYQVKEGKKAKMSLQRYQTITKGTMNDAALGQANIWRKAAYDDNMVLDDKNHPVVALLRQPNPHQGMDQFMESVCGFHILSGEANIYGNSGKNPKGPIVELGCLPTQYIEDIYGPNPYEILGHKFAIQNGVPIAKENLLRWKNWRPSFDYSTRVHMRGLSPVQVAWKNYLMSDSAGEQAANILKNGGGKGALSPQPVNNMLTPMNDTQVNLATTAVNQRFNGSHNAGNIGILARPYDYLDFGLNSVDMQILETMKFTTAQWCRVLGLPPALFDTDHMADNNYQNAMRDLVTNTVVPMLGAFRDRFNTWLLPRLGYQGKVFIDFDISALPEMQRDFEKLINGLRQAYWWTEDEKRMAQNMEPKGGAYDTSLVPTGMVPIEMIGQDLGTEPDPVKPGGDEDDEEVPY
jgi:HK97 family phage portal protein